MAFATEICIGWRYIAEEMGKAGNCWRLGAATHTSGNDRTEDHRELAMDQLAASMSKVIGQNLIVTEALTARPGSARRSAPLAGITDGYERLWSVRPGMPYRDILVTQADSSDGAMGSFGIISVSAAVVAMTVSVALLVDTAFIIYRSRWRTGARPGRAMPLSPLTAVASTLSFGVLATFAVLVVRQRPESILEWSIAVALILGAVGSSSPVVATVPRLFLRRDSGRRSPAGAGRPGGKAATLVAAIFLVALGFVAIGVRLGLEQLSGSEQPRSISVLLSQLLLITSGSGALAFTVVEFVKRQSPLRRLYNRRIVDGYFHPPLEVIRLEIQDRQRESADGVGVRTPMAPLAPISYAADIQQLSAQVGHAARMLLRASADSALPSRVVESLIQSVLGDRHTQYNIYELSDERHQAILDEALESRIDAFQIEATAGWHSLLRTVASFAAAVFACMLVWATHAGELAIGLAAGLGLVVGGPISWIIRDVVRVIERKAAY